MAIDIRTLHTTGYFTVREDTHVTRVYRELVTEQDADGSWLVYAVDPETVGDDGEAMVSASLRVKDDAGKDLVQSLFSIISNPVGVLRQRTVVSS